MKKVLATLLIATVGLTTLLANGVSEGVINSNGTMTGSEVTVIDDMTLETVEGETLVDETMVQNQYGPQSQRAGQNNRMSPNQKGGRPNNNGGLREGMEPANRDGIRNQSPEMMMERQQMNSEDCLVEDGLQLQNGENRRSNNEGPSNRATMNNKMSAQGNVGTGRVQSTNQINNSMGKQSSNRANNNGSSANLNTNSGRFESKGQRPMGPGYENSNQANNQPNRLNANADMAGTYNEVCRFEEGGQRPMGPGYENSNQANNQPNRLNANAAMAGAYNEDCRFEEGGQRPMGPGFDNQGPGRRHPGMRYNSQMVDDSQATVDSQTVTEAEVL